jgi:hypothetical protein
LLPSGWAIIRLGKTEHARLITSETNPAKRGGV